LDKYEVKNRNNIIKDTDFSDEEYVQEMDDLNLKYFNK